MKYLLSILGIFLLSCSAYAGKISIRSFVVKYELPGDVSTWGPDAANAVVASDNGPTDNTKIVFTIKQSGGKALCGITPQGAAYETINATRVMTTNYITGVIGNCELKPGTYTLCLQVFNADNFPLCDEECREFTVAEPKQVQQKYSGPQTVYPEDNASFTPTKLKEPLILKWLPVVPPLPQGDVTYKVKVYALEKNQELTAAINSNTPIFETEAKTPQAIFRMPEEYLSAKENRKFGWRVQAVNSKGEGYGPNNGFSNNAMFMMNGSVACGLATKIDSIVCLPLVNGKTAYKICLVLTNTGSAALNFNNSTNISQNSATPPYGIPGGSLANIIWSSCGSISFVYGSMPSTIPPGSITVCFKIVVNSLLSGNKIDLITYASVLGSGGLCTPNPFDTISAPTCSCTDCDKITIDTGGLTATPYGSNGNQFSLSGNINVNVPIYGLEFELQSYSYSATPSACSNGVTGIEQSGMFVIPGTTINNSSAIQIFNETISGSSTTDNNASKDVKLITTSPMTGSIPINLLIGLPGPIAGLNSGCCKMQYSVCIKIKVFYDKTSCKSCTFLRCIKFNN